MTDLNAFRAGERAERGRSTAAASKKAGNARNGEGMVGCAWTRAAAIKWARVSVNAIRGAEEGSAKREADERVRERERWWRVALGLRRGRDSPRARGGMAAGSAAGRDDGREGVLWWEREGAVESVGELGGDCLRGWAPTGKSRLGKARYGPRGRQEGWRLRSGRGGVEDVR